MFETFLKGDRSYHKKGKYKMNETMNYIRTMFDTEEFTDNLNEAIFLFPDGSMIDGGFFDGIRSVDHNCLKSCFPDKTWEQIHDETGVIRLIPETHDALISETQEVNALQFEILTYTNGGYLLHYYC